MPPKKKNLGKKGVQYISPPSSMISSSSNEGLEECLGNDESEGTTNEVPKNLSRERVLKQFCVLPSPNVPNQTFTKSFSTKCKPEHFLDGVGNLTERQLQDVRELGFDGLLLMKLKSLPLGLVPWLVQNFNPHSRLQNLGNGSLYYITPDDVHDILGIPIHPDNKIMAITHHGKGQKKDASLVQKWMDLLNVSKEDDLTLDKVTKAFSCHENGGVVFKSLFVMFAVSSLLSPNSERKVDKSLFKVLEDASQLHRLDWCTFVLERLCTAVKRYLSNSNQTVVNGCLLVLLISYLHRLPFQGIRAPTTLPLLRNWADKEVKARANKEFLVGYGKGIVDTTFPISKVYSQWACGSPNLARPNAYQRDNMVRSCFEIGESSSGFIRYAIPNNLLRDVAIKECAKDPLDEAIQIFKRDIEVVTMEYMKKVGTFQFGKTRESEEKVDGLSQIDIFASQTQLIFEDPTWQAEMDHIVATMIKKSGTLVASSGSDKENTSYVEPNKSPEAHDVPVENLMSEHEVINVRPSLPQEHVVVTDICSVDLGPIDVNVLFVSKFMKENKIYFMGLRQLEKEVADYCFLAETTPPNEVLASFFDQHSLTRHDILTLQSFCKIDLIVVECWALYMNEIARRCNQHPITFCFGLSHSDDLKNLLSTGDPCTQNLDRLHTTWRQWVDLNHPSWDLSKVHLFFVPYYHDGHFCLVVVNIVARMVHFLDTDCHDDNEFPYYISETVRDEISNFLESVAHPNSTDVVEYEIESMDFKWAVDENNDDGVYLMYFMEQFDGNHNLTPLKKALQRRFYRASVCARLVTCDLNTRRDEILRSVADFTISKAHMIPTIEKERKSRRHVTNVAMKRTKKVPRK